MSPEIQILSEYLDGELPQDLRVLVEERLAKDPRFKANHDKLLSLREHMHRGRFAGAAYLSASVLSAAQTRVWDNIQRSIGRKSPKPGWLAKAKDFFRMSVSLPVPAIAAMCVVVLSLGLVAVARGGPSDNAGNIASVDQANAFNISASSHIATGVPASGMPVSLDGLMQPSASPGTLQSSNGLSVKIEVQNIRQLLNLLENSQGIGDVTIQLPQIQTSDDLGEPVLLRASDIEKSQP